MNHIHNMLNSIEFELVSSHLLCPKVCLVTKIQPGVQLDFPFSFRPCRQTLEGRAVRQVGRAVRTGVLIWSRPGCLDSMADSKMGNG